MDEKGTSDPSVTAGDLSKKSEWPGRGSHASGLGHTHSSPLERCASVCVRTHGGTVVTADRYSD